MLQNKLGVGLLASLLLLGGAVGPLAGCGGDDDDAAAGDDDDDDDTTSSSGGAVSQAECSSTCSSRTSECDVPEAQASQICSEICGGSLSKATLDCIQALPCSSDQSDISACKNAKPSGSSSSGGGGGGSSSGGVASEPATLSIDVDYDTDPSIAASYYTLSIDVKSGVVVQPNIAVATGPDLGKGTLTVANVPAACKSELETTVSLGGVSSHTFVAQLFGPVAECGTFFEGLGDFDVSVTGAPYDSGAKADVTIHFSKK